MFTFLLVVGFCLAYLFLRFFFPLFFGGPIPRFSRRTYLRFLQIAAAILVVIGFTLWMEDRILANRVLHAFGGGFMAVFLLWLAYRDGETRITQFQFLAFSVLTATGMGVANEILEFFMQNYFGFMFAPYVNDTWLDLISNTVGIFLGAALFTPLLKSRFR